VTAKRRWILCPESRKDKEEWIAALLPMIGGESATAEVERPAAFDRMQTGNWVSKGAAKRVSRVSVSGGQGIAVLRAAEVKRGWLERQEEGGGWVRRFFVLETRSKRDGASEASLEYYLDETLAIDEDSETIHLMPGTTAGQSAADGSRQHVLQVDTFTGMRLVFAATSSAECLEWLDAIRDSVVDVSRPATGLGALGTAVESGRLNSTASEIASGQGRDIPDESLRVHAGWLVKKGEGLMAKSQQRWFVLYRNAEVHYFDSDSMGVKNHKGVVVLAGVKPQHITRVKPGSTDYSFTIATPKRKWQLKAADQATFDVWNNALLSIVGAT